jgi:ActR/RegA family two-component response regulator
MSDHTKEILLVEDMERFSTPLTRWLGEAGYQVTLAKSYRQALSALDENRYHLAIVDIRLEDADAENKQGMDLLVEFEKRQLGDVMACIVFTAYPDVDTILEATQKRRVDRYIQKKADGYRTELLEAVRELFEDKIKINFDLVYDVGSNGLVFDIAGDVRWPIASRPRPDLLAAQVQDLFGKLFVKARRIYVSKLKPGLSGAAVVHVQPTWERGLGPSYVAKIGRRDKVELEKTNYEEYVHPYLPHNTITQVDAACTRDMGAILYTFAQGDLAPLEEFDDFYRRNPSETIATSLRNLFQNTGRYWYDHRDRKFKSLPQLYYEAFQLDQEKLVGRIQVVLPQFDPERETFFLDRIAVQATNPIAWLARHYDECLMPVFHSITHGDLTGRNIMVNEEGQCWLIDFYRTYESHILRDFVILETDIKYRLLPAPGWKAFRLLEETLLKIDPAEPASTLDANLPVDIQKAAHVIAELRAIASEFSRGLSSHKDSRKEFLISLLMATLNVVRLRHTEEERKLQAMLSAALICAELDALARREPLRPSFDDYARSPAQDDLPALAQSTVQATVQQRYLAEQLNARNLILFLGSAKPPGADWPTLEELAEQLMRGINHDPPPGDPPRKLLAIYSNKIGMGRGHLIDKLVHYFESHAPPPFFEQVAAFEWYAVYTTNQHTYLEDACERKGHVQREVIVSPTHQADVSAGKMPIYKLYGCLGQEHRREPPTTLPITAYDHGDPQTQVRIEQFVADMKRDLARGKLLLVFYPSEEELDMAHRWCQSLEGDGLIWITGADLTEEDQDYYRYLGLRVLPDDPPDLLAVLSELTQP